jgi:hypothetical protein
MSPLALHRSRAARPSQRTLRSRGVATLVVVMVLFFLVAMVAAYTNRTLIFDQRTSTNQLRSAQAFTTAEAGVDWVLAQLNAGLLDNSCRPSTTVDNDDHRSLRDRLLLVQATDADTGLLDGSVRPRLRDFTEQLVSRCVFNGSATDSLGWNCTCDRDGAALDDPTRPAGDQPAPAFAFNFARMTYETSVVELPKTVTRLAVIGCSQVSNCFDLDVGADAGSSVSNVNMLISLRPALRTQPGSPLTVGGSVTAMPAGGFAGGQSIRLVNNPLVALNSGKKEPSSGLTVVAGGSVPATNMLLESVPGTPGAATRAENDASLALPAVPAAAFPPLGLTTRDRFFVSSFGMAPETYRLQPGIVRLPCAAGSPCTAAAVRTAMQRNPGQAIWLSGAGGLTLDSNLGEANDDPTQPVARGPLMLIVEGPVTASDGVVVWGVIYGHNAAWTWTVNGAVTIQGAVLSEGDFTLVGGATAPRLTIDYSNAHDKGVFNFLRGRAGSYARFNTGWRDWYN